MKKLILIGICLWCGLSVLAQFEVRGVSHCTLLTSSDGIQGVDYVAVVSGVSSDAALAYTGAEPVDNVNWYEYSAQNLQPSTPIFQRQTEIFVESGHGYICEAGQEKWYVWIVEYTTPDIILFEPAPDNDLACETTVFQVEMAESSNMKYCDRYGTDHVVKREFTLSYTTKNYPEGGDDWEVKPIEELNGSPVTVKFPTDRISVDASLDPSTDFVLSGDQFAREWGMELFEFTAQKTPDLLFPVKSHLTSIVTVREALNEISRPSEAEPTPPIKGSAPLEILFESRPSDPDQALYDWKIYKGNELLLTRTDEDLRYTFEDFGTYWVKLLVYKDYENGVRCSMPDSVEVSVSESFLGVPNVFTPNGDGKNDEFRVAYRSLESFHCWVYNSWGKLVYEWDDPAKGWDGRVNGRKNAPTGTYFYIIKAKGTDGVVHNRKGDINIIR